MNHPTGTFVIVDGHRCLVLGHRPVPENGRSVEVIDLQSRRFRLVAPEQVVEAPAGESPTRDETRWVAEYMAARRSEVRSVALEQHRANRFRTEGEVNKVLTELELAPYERERTGTYEIRVRVSGSRNLTRSEAVDRLNRAFRETSLGEGLRFERPPAGTLYDWT